MSSPLKYRVLKRALDIGLAGAGLTISLPVLAVAGAAVALDSPGPILYRSRRAGRHGKPIDVLKLRTMSAEQQLGAPQLTAANDARITRIGRWLRRTKIDELPQLWNVLRGDMSIVGPRPEVQRYVDLFPKEFQEILTVRPGLTGRAALAYVDEEEILGAQENPERFYLETILPHKIELCLQYVRHPSLRSDAVIVLKTIGQVVHRLPPLKRAEPRPSAHTETPKSVPETAPTSTPKTLLVIGAGRLQVPAYTTARRMGLRVIGVDRNPRAPAVDFADRAYTVDTHDIDGILRVAKAEKVSAVLTLCTDLPVRAVAAASRAMGLPSLSLGTADVATHKGRMRAAFAAGEAPIPKYQLAKSPEEVAAAARTIGLPVIVKPPASSGSRGVFKISDMAQVNQAFAHASEFADGDAVLVEEFIDGPEVSIETLSFRGEHRIVSITDKRTTGDPFWIETGHAEPSRHSPSDQAALRAAALCGLRALGIDNSAGHVEIKLGPRGPVLMEIGARLGGDFITTELVPRSTGVDMVECCIRIAMGEQPDWEQRFSKGASIAYLSARPGRVVHVAGVERAQHMPGVVRLEVDVKSGDEVPRLESSLDRVGFVIAEGPDAATAEERALAAARQVLIEVNET